MKIELPLRTYSLANQREHWGVRMRRAKAERQAAYLVTPKGIKPPCTVVLTRVAHHTLDGDNLQGCFKSIRDGIAQKLGVDDASPLVKWEYAQERAKPKQFAVRIEILEGK